MMLAAHPDADHIGDLARWRRSSARRVAYSDDVGTTQRTGRFIAALHYRTLRSSLSSVGQTLHLGSLTAKVLNPASDGSDTNADSISRCSTSTATGYC